MNRLILLLLAGCLGLLAWSVNDDLLEAARKGDLATVKALVEKGAAVETATPYGQTPLYLAAMNGYEEVVRFLLEKGANPNIKDSFYKAGVLDFVLQRKHIAVAKLLIRTGKFNADETLASIAAVGNAELAQALLETGKPSQAALDKAYEQALDQKQADVVAVLKKAGAHEPAPAVTVDAKTLESYTGTYKSDQIPLDIRVFVKDGQLYMQGSGQPEFPVKAKTATTFEFALAGITVEFDSPSSFTLKQGPGSYRFKKAVTQ